MTDKIIIRILLGATFVFALLFIVTMCTAKERISNLEQIESLYSISQDSLKTERNAKNEEIAKVEVLEAEQNTLFTQLHLRDKDINRLQNLIKKYEKENGNLNTAIIISNETILSLRDSLKSLIIGYTQDPDTPNVSYPIYQREINKEWYSGNIIMGFNILDLSLKVKNDYDITIGDEKVSLFKRKQYANITNLNPDTETKVMKVYDKKEKKTNFIRNTGIAAGIGFIVGILIK
jgi:hypothetical protein